MRKDFTRNKRGSLYRKLVQRYTPMKNSYKSSFALLVKGKNRFPLVQGIQTTTPVVNALKIIVLFHQQMYHFVLRTFVPGILKS